MKKTVLIATMALVTISAFAQAPKFAHVNYAELVQLSPEADKARETLAASSKEAEETYTAMAEEFQNKYQQYQQKAASWTDTVRETKGRELSEIQGRLEDFQRNIQQELQQQQSQLMAPIQQKAQDVVERLAKEGSYIYVFEINSLLYVDTAQSVDLTPAARRELGIPEGRTLETLQAELQAQL